MREALRVAVFRRLLASYAGDECGDWFVSIAAAVLVFEETQSAMATTALFLANRFAPAFVVPALAARLDRLRPTQALAGLYGLDVFVLVALAASTTNFSLALVCALAFADGILAATGRAITRSATATVLTGVGLLREGNASLNIAFGVMNIAAPAIAGLLVAATSPRVVFLVGAAIFLALSLLMLTTRGPSGVADDHSWVRRLREGISGSLGDVRIRTLLIVEAVLLVLFSMATPIEIVLAKDTLDAGDAGYGLLVAAWGSGMVVGSVLFTRILRYSMVRVLVVASALVGVSYVLIGISPTIVWAMAAAVIGGIGNGMQWVTFVTSIQEAVGEEMQTRIAGIFEAIGTAMPGVGFLLGGVVASLFDPRIAFVSAGAGVALVLVAFLGSWLALRRAIAAAT